MLKLAGTTERAGGHQSTGLGSDTIITASDWRKQPYSNTALYTQYTKFVAIIKT